MEELKILVERYGNLKSEMDSYKKQVDEDNKAIKQIMSETGVTEFSAGGFTAKYSVSKSESFDEDKLISKIRELNPVKDGKYADEMGLIEYVPRVNMEVLENLIYNGNINAAELANCKVTKETPKLTIKKG